MTLPKVRKDGIGGGGNGLNTSKRMHYAAGLGDGNIHMTKQQQQQQQGLRGRKRGRGIDNDDFQSPFLRSVEHVNRNDAEIRDGTSSSALDDHAVRPDVLSNHGIRNANTPSAVTSDGPWQLSVIMLLGIIVVLIGLFIHFSTDPSGQQSNKYFRSRIKKKMQYKSPNYRKKTDEWSDDADITEEDNDYIGDNEGDGDGDSGSSCVGITKKKRMTVPSSPIPNAPNDPTARLYYPQQESRLRKSATQQQQQQQQMQPHPSPGGMSTSYQTTKSRQSRPSAPTSSGRMDAYKKSPGVGITRHSPDGLPPSPPFLRNESGLGSGLEGFEHSVDNNYSPADSGEFMAWKRSDNNKESPVEIAIASSDAAPTGKPIVKPMGTFTPTESFASMSHVNTANEDTVELSTPPLSSEEEAKMESPNKRTIGSLPDPLIHESPALRRFLEEKEAMSSPRRSPHPTYKIPSSGFTDFPTPRIVNTCGKSELALKLMEKGGHNVPLPFNKDIQDNRVGSSIDASAPAFSNDGLPGLPLVPNLNNESGHIDAPHSVLLEELHLIRMESGVQGPRWISKYESELEEAPSQKIPGGSPCRTGGQNYHHPMFGTDDNAWNEALDTASLAKKQQETENIAKLKEASSMLDSANDPRNSIQHIRKDLTESSDSSSSLSSRISFSDLKLEDVIGGGGFGQVWKAKWKGTPVAVKVLTGLAQAEAVPKAVLEEFIAEINIVSGFRHPNICLFMGACLDPPNRAIVTELCENGSLWDALRTPLSSPYQVADGESRTAWPLNLYETLSPPPTTLGESSSVNNVSPPVAPAGTWPWVLVKRVASGTARGMCYLHSGEPPVLHRDLKSANILLDESYTAKLADFGLSRLKAVRSGMTGNCGTVQWMAPEVLCNEDYAEPADVFSFGIILWEMLTKECPYEGMTPIQCALSVLNENKRPEIPEWCPQSFRALIKNCVERDPKARPTFPQILTALDALP
jgi:hypothetical protein